MSNNAGPYRTARAALRPLLFGLLLLPALIPLLQGDALPCTHDNIFHSYRIVAMRDMLRHGWLFSRWVPNLALGYGYPFFNYREPLPYLVGEALYVTGLQLPLVLGLLYAASLVGAAWGAYALGRDLFGERAGWVAGVAYGLSPYLLMDSLRRGNMPESVGLALVPWLFVVTRRIILHRRQSDIVVTTLLLAALFLSHNITSLLLAPFLGAYVLLLAWLHRDRGRWPYAFAAVGLAVLLTAWFWLPALTEQDYAQLHLSRTTRNNDFRYNFVTWREMLLTLPVPYDPDYLNAPMRVMIGTGQIALGTLGAVLGLFGRNRRRSRAVVALLMCAAVGYLWMATPGALGLWNRVDILSFVQFPWRMVGRALLPICLLSGLAVELVVSWLSPRRSVTQDRLSVSVVLLAVCGLTLLGWPETYPPKGICPSLPFPDMRELYARETEGWLGMDPESSYFPIWVEDHPHDMTLAEAFVNGRLPERFDLSAMPSGAQVLDAVYRPLGASLRVISPVSFTGRWLGLYFPGWSASIDGMAVPVWPEEDSGLLLFEVPPGEHELTVRFGSTTARRVGVGLATAGIVLGAGLLAVTSRLDRTNRGVVAEDGGVEQNRPASAADATAKTLLLAALALFLLRILVVNRYETPIRRSRLEYDQLPEVSAQLRTRYANGLDLLGYSLDTELRTADAELRVDLLWQASVPIEGSYRMTVLLRGADGQIWSPAGTARPRGYEDPIDTAAWTSGQYAYDPHIVTLLPGAPPGDYDVVIRVFAKDTLALDSVVGSLGEPLGVDLVVGSATFTRPGDVPALTALGVTDDEPVSLCGQLGLWRMASDRATGRPGDVIAVQWVWEAVASPEPRVEATLALLSSDNTAVRTWALPLVAGWWPTDSWQPGDRWAGRHIVRLPGDLDSGSYRLTVSLPECPNMAEVPVAVDAPVRVWEVPSGYAPMSVIFSPPDASDVPHVELVGLRLSDRDATAGQTLEAGLAWRALTAMDTSYRVFLHLLDGEGRLVAQDDGEPAAWSRPTTGWATGEVVVEMRQVTVPADAEPGSYTLRVGLYEEEGPRLQLPGGDDGTVLATITVR